MSHSKFKYLVLAAFTLVCAVATCGRADSIETHDNPVPNGTIHVANGDTDRNDWEGIPWYEIDDDFDEFFPVDIDRVRIAHDAVNIYVHLQALTWDVNELWRVGLYLDTDQDNTTGYNGNFIAVGADYFVEDVSSFEFTGVAQTEWAWRPTGELARDQTLLTDVEIAIPRQAIGNPASIDFLLFANNYCCDFQTPDDVYPNFGATLFGDFFTYELSTVILAGDFDGNGTLDSVDLDSLTTQSASGNNLSTFDLNGDALVNDRDVAVWVKELFGSWIGDANLDREFNSSDLVTVLASGTYEANIDSVWTTGDFNGDGRTNSTDLVAALADGGYEQGPLAAVPVPEPTSMFLIFCATAGLGARWRRARGSAASSN